jgi:hypothetical protein
MANGVVKAYVSTVAVLPVVEEKARASELIDTAPPGVVGVGVGETAQGQNRR